MPYPRIRGSPRGHTSIHAIPEHRVEVAVIGAGIAGIAAAYYLCADGGRTSALLIDPRAPMSYTSAQSGDNYRNWWPHPTMTAFTSDSIELMRSLAAESDNAFNMTGRGYALASRDSGAAEKLFGLASGIDVDVYTGSRRIREAFPALSADVVNLFHIRNGGDISGQQLGALMLERIRDSGGALLRGEVVDIERGGPWRIAVQAGDETLRVEADVIVNAAGPFVHKISAMLGIELPVRNVYQQKVAFEDGLGAVPRDMPFTIDLDRKRLEWTDEERAMLGEDAELKWLTGELPGGTHVRPDGGPRGKWIKLGWAYNERVSEPQRDLANEPAIDPQFPEIVIRAAAQLIPTLAPYIESPPARYSHYGGYYTMTEENWPLIGPAGPEGAFIVGALSGFGSMSACAAGRLCAGWIRGTDLPDYAVPLSPERYRDAALMAALRTAEKGLL